MAKDDWAIVVGIRFYPELDNLDGPENDARAFCNWLVSPNGGAVPREHVQLILSSQYKLPFHSADEAKPTAERIQKALEKLQNIALENQREGRGLRIGRRLYLYMSGHGFTPRDDQTGLLTANATRMRVGPGFHILGQYNADWFYKAGCFDEIVLFMDCCREIYQVPALNMPYRDLIDEDAVNRVKRFYAFGTKWSRLSREKKIDGVIHGVFTAAVLKGLKGAACEPNSGGQITVDSLRNYLYNNMKNFLTPKELADPDIPKEPDIPNFGSSFILATVPVPKYPVTIHVPPDLVGKQAEILDGKNFNVVESTPALPPVWSVSLERGKYLAEVLGNGLRRTTITVSGIGGVDVSF